jgi:hypothetical protein
VTGFILEVHEQIGSLSKKPIEFAAMENRESDLAELLVVGVGMELDLEEDTTTNDRLVGLLGSDCMYAAQGRIRGTTSRIESIRSDLGRLGQ